VGRSRVGDHCGGCPLSVVVVPLFGHRVPCRQVGVGGRKESLAGGELEAGSAPAVSPPRRGGAEDGADSQARGLLVAPSIQAWEGKREEPRSRARNLSCASGSGALQVLGGPQGEVFGRRAAGGATSPTSCRSQ